MIRVLIADDEKKVCQLIWALVKWEDFDMEVVGFAHDGLEALELMSEKKPDLVITDIRMPGKDGLELIYLGKKENPELEFIIVSGYKHFEYAQTAIKLGVNDYLLKPIKKSELNATLSKIQQKFKFKTNQLDVDERLKLNMKDSIEKIRNGFFADYLLKEEVFGYENFTIDYFNSKYHFNFEKGIFQTLVINVDSFDEVFYKVGMHVFGEKVQEIVSRYFENSCFDFKTYIDCRKCIVILNYDENEKENIRKKIREILSELVVQSNIFDNVEATITIGEAFNKVFQLRESYNDAQLKSNQRIVEGRGKIIDICNSEQWSKTLNQGNKILNIVLSDFTKNITKAVEVLDEDMIFESAMVLQRSMMVLEIDGISLIEGAKGAINILVMQLRNHQFNTDLTKDIQEKFEKDIQKYFSSEQLFENMNFVVKDIFNEVMTEKKKVEVKPIRMAKKYIQTNYMRHISLEEVSSVVGFSPAYFSSMFKKESGQNFMEYISEVRMDRAKDFLKTTNWSVASICESVGYSDVKHFTQNFRKYTGLNPNEFRRFYAWAGEDDEI